MDQTTIDALGPSPIFPYLLRVFTSFDESLTSAVVEMARLGVENLVSFYVSIDDRQPDHYSVNIHQPSLTLPSREYYTQTDIMEKYRQGLVSILGLVLDKGDSKIFSENSETVVDRFVNFETRLANITLPIGDLQDPNAIYNPMTITELQQHYPFLNWSQALQSLSPNELPEKMIVTVPKYFKTLNGLLVEDGEALREYFLIKTIITKIPNLDRATRKIYQNTIGKLTTGATQAQPRGRECTASTSGAFGQLLGRYFVMKSFGGEPERQQVSEFIDRILESWKSRLEKNDWLDKETKTKAIEKVNKIGHQEAYSIFSPDVRSPQSLAAFYSDISVNPKDFFGNQMSAYQSDFKKEWSKVGQTVNKEEWFMTPHEVNAYYTPNFNKIVIPAGILQTPFYNTGVPDYLNYGGIGAVIGHEITHAFDNSGRLYDGEGFLNSWWSNTTSRAFEDKSQCFIKQYGSFSIKGPDNKEYPVDGKMTLGENLADNGGLSAAYDAMNNNEKTVLAGLDFLTPEQLFFINYGRVWCSSMRPEMAVRRVRTDVHSPAKVRVNGAIQNNLEFQKAFSCKKQVMNPTKKCLIW